MNTYKIHPAIGVARVGNSEDFYLAPETPGGLPINRDGRPFVESDFRDATGALRRQGVRFEIHRYDHDRPGAAGTPIRPGSDGVARIEWTVHPANKKAVWYEFYVGAGENGYSSNHRLRNAQITDPDERRNLIIDPGPRTLTGSGQSVDFSRSDNPDGYPMQFPRDGLTPSDIESLGRLETDDDGRLIFVGGYGRSGSTVKPPRIVDYANNDSWWDDTADGPVTARVIMDDGSAVEIEHPSWVVVAPPRYAPQLLNVVTLYDTIFDISVRTMGIRPDIFAEGLWNETFHPSWDQDVRPILERIHRYPWVVAIPRDAHDLDLEKLGNPNPAYKGMRQFYLGLIRPPDSPSLLTSPDTGLPLMPMLCGDNCFQPGPVGSPYATLTQTQYFYLQQWASGAFVESAPSTESRGEALDRTALENCVGAAFSPGIEVTWVCRNPRLYTAPFRINAKQVVEPPLSLGQDFADGLEPGDLCKYMAVPWQADFNECSAELVGDRYLWWWPVQRPSFVHVERHGRLVQVPWLGTDTDQAAPNYLEFKDDYEMVEHWHELGFVFNVGTGDNPVFLEVARQLERRNDGSSSSG
jgi:hypothetical protein